MQRAERTTTGGVIIKPYLRYKTSGMSKQTRGEGGDTLRSISLQEWHEATSKWLPRIMDCVEEGISATDRDGHPDWSSRFKFVKMVLEYNLGKPKETVNHTFDQEMPQIFYPLKEGEE